VSHSTYLPEKMGSATVSPTGAFEAGSFHEFTVTYTAGYFGIDDTGSLKIVHRFASDMGRPQFTVPEAPNYTTVEASNGAILHVEYDMKRNIRPWDKTVYIKVVRGFLREGDEIVVRFGDKRQGSPGMRVQTFCEDTFEFRVLVDAIATYNYVELPTQPTISIIPGPPAIYKAILPTLRRVGDSFRLCMKGEDRWGNPSDLCEDTFTLRANMKIDGLPAAVKFEVGGFGQIIEGLSVKSEGDLSIELLDEKDAVVVVSNPCRLTAVNAPGADLLPYWGDLHGQSEETIGTNSARDFYDFARDKAFLDACVHQGNDFQITNEFWQWLNELSAEFNVDDKFIVFPGWEWSGNTGLGGDRNILHMKEGRQIHRSSHALVDDLSDTDTDCNSANDLFEALKAGAHGDFHITSHRFDEPQALELVASAQVAVAIHGRKDDGTETVWLGARAEALRDAIGAALRDAGFDAAPNTTLPGVHETNICNRTRSGEGVQLELPRSLRRILAEDADMLERFCLAVREAL